VEDVDGVHGRLALLLESEHQVDPLAQHLGHLVRLQRLAVHEHEEARVVARPGRQVHVVDALAVLPQAEVEACGEEEESSQSVCGRKYTLIQPNRQSES